MKYLVTKLNETKVVKNGKRLYRLAKVAAWITKNGDAKVKEDFKALLLG